MLLVLIFLIAITLILLRLFSLETLRETALEIKFSKG